jgi:hypothetical protein
MKKLKRSTLAAVLMMSVVLICTIIPTFASNDNHQFEFDLVPGSNEKYAPARYRQTSNSANKWKVNFKKSGEGDGTCTKFRLVKHTNKAVKTDAKFIYSGTGAHYYNAMASLNQTDVTLSAQDDENTGSVYHASGVWDEEIN